MTAPDAIRRKALAVLREGRLTVLTVKSTWGGDGQPVVVTATAKVEGTRGTYAVDLADGRWTCTCMTGAAGVRCGHILATQLVTGTAEGRRAA